MIFSVKEIAKVKKAEEKLDVEENTSSGETN